MSMHSCYVHPICFIGLSLCSCCNFLEVGYIINNGLARKTPQQKVPPMLSPNTINTIGFATGLSIASIEFVSVIALLTARRWMERKVPRLTSHLAIAAKTTSYRLFAGLDTFLLSFLITGSGWMATTIIGWEVLTKFTLYYSHEWVWNKKVFRRFMLVKTA